MHRIVIGPLAENDAAVAVNWYNNARDGLGDEFLLALEARLYAISRNPLQFPVIYKAIRRALTERFPYAIFFIVESNSIFVLAIIHTHQNPKIWKKRK